MVHSNVLCLKNKAKSEYLGGARAAPTPSNAYTRNGHPTSKSACIEIHGSASRSIQLFSVPKRQAIQRRPSYLGVPPRPRYKFTRRLGAPYCNVIVAPDAGWSRDYLLVFFAIVLDTCRRSMLTNHLVYHSLVQFSGVPDL